MRKHLAILLHVKDMLQGDPITESVLQLVEEHKYLEASRLIRKERPRLYRAVASAYLLGAHDGATSEMQP